MAQVRGNRKDKASIRKTIKVLTGQKVWSLAVCVKSNGVTLIIKKGKLLQRSRECFRELFPDVREKRTIHKNIDEPGVRK